MSEKEVKKTSFSDKAQDNRREWVGWYKHYLLESGKIKNKENHDSKFAKQGFANSQETQDNGKRETCLYRNRLQPDFEKQSIHKLLSPAQASILDCAERVWKVAQQYLYPHFTRESAFYEYQIINQIIDVIELEYLPLMQIKTLREYYQEFCQRIVLVACYLDKHAGDKYVPSPVDYFNPRNSRGFVGTRKWLLNKLDRKEQNKKAYQKKKLLQKAEKAFLDAKLEGVEATVFQIYRYFERQVNSFQDTTVQNNYAKLAQRFCVDRT